MGWWRLLFQRRFGPFFCTQFLIAFNDNVYKNALIALITYQTISLMGMSPEKLVAFCGGIFILPFLLLSGSAGQLADKYPKARLIRIVKVAEILILAVGAIGFIVQSLTLLLVVLVLMGVHSAYFGPIKYSILPQLMSPKELVQANALVQGGTLIAILTGTILAGALYDLNTPLHSAIWITALAVAVLGWLVSFGVPMHSPADPNLRVNRNPLKPTWTLCRDARRNRVIWRSILGVSWFWGVGSIILGMIPGYAKEGLHGSVMVMTLFLALFSIGVAVGSMLCARLSRRALELRLVPVGCLGMSLFLFDLYLAGLAPVAAGQPLLSVGEFLSRPGSLRVAVDLTLLAVSGGIFTIPLFTLMQLRAPKGYGSRVIAANNTVNCIFIFSGAIVLIGLFSLKLNYPQIFLVLSVVNLAVCGWLFVREPEFRRRSELTTAPAT